MQATDQTERPAAPRGRSLLPLLLAALALVALLSLLVGAGDLSDERWRETFLRLRAVRVGAACLVGAGLATGGVLLQGLFRNPLADPGVIGTSAGAVLGGMVAALAAHSLGGAIVGLPAVVLLPVGAVLGGLGSLWLVLLVARRAPDNLTVLLAGVVLGMLVASLGAAVSAWAQRDYELSRSLMAFSFGSIDARGPEQLLLAAPLVLGGLWAARRWSPELDVLLSGEEEAASLGVDLVRARRWLVVWAALPVAGAVAISGSIAFVGLVVPHIVRGRVGPSHARLVPAAAVGGAVFVLVCDVLARLAPTTGEVPLGVVSGLLGAPLFLYLLVGTRREAAL